MPFFEEGREPPRLRAPASPGFTARPAVLRRNLRAFERAYAHSSPSGRATFLAWSPTKKCELPFQVTSALGECSFDIRAQRKQGGYVHLLEIGSDHSILLKYGFQPVSLIHSNHGPAGRPCTLDGSRVARQRN
jgi:hypothetical protein